MAVSPYSITNPSTFDTGYTNHPFGDSFTTNQRLFYYPVLRDKMRDQSAYAQFTPFKVDVPNLGSGAKTMQVTQLLNSHANFDKIGPREFWLKSSRIDSQALTITFDSYGGKFAYMKYDAMINYWKLNGGTGSAGALAAICQSQLGDNMVDVMDYLSRNALLNLPFKTYGGTATSFNDIDSSSTLTTALLNKVQLRMKYRRVPGALDPTGRGTSIVCVTSPGVLYDIQAQTDPKDWLYPNAYADPSRLLNYEIGSYRGVRFVENVRATLWNAGAIIKQATVSAAITAGDGAPDPTTTLVDSVNAVGQPGMTHYIQLTAATDMTPFVVGDWVTIHKQRTSAFGVTNGVDYREGSAEHRRIAVIDAGNYRLSFTEPIMEDFTTVITTNVYAYVTKARHVHSASFIGGNDAVVIGVGDLPQVYAPPPVDDRLSIYRYTWDAFMGYQNYNVNVAENWFGAGSFADIGDISAEQ